MQIASAHTELLLRTKNTPRKIPPTPQNPHSSISSCLPQCCGAHGTAQECDAGQWHLHGVQLSITYMEGVQERICSHSFYLLHSHREYLPLTPGLIQSFFSHSHENLEQGMKSPLGAVWEIRVHGLLPRSSFELLGLLYAISQPCPAIMCHVTWAFEDSTV